MYLDGLVCSKIIERFQCQVRQFSSPYRWSLPVAFLIEWILADSPRRLYQICCRGCLCIHQVSLAVGMTLRGVSARCICHIRSHKQCHPKFRCRSPCAHVPNTPKTFKSVKSFRATVSFLERTRERLVLTEEKQDEIVTRLQADG